MVQICTYPELKIVAIGGVVEGIALEPPASRRDAHALD